MQESIIWDEFLKIVKEEEGSQVVETWFKAVIPQTIDPSSGVVILTVPNMFVLRWIKEHYFGLVERHLARLLNTPQISLSLVTEKQLTPQAPAVIPHFVPARTTLITQNGQEEHEEGTHSPTALVSQQTAKKGRPQTPINPLYQFDTFVVGPSNSLAHGAAYAVSQSLGTAYNPLFIYGGTGLGKTHLLHAIGNEARRRSKDVLVHYETADQFIHKFIQAIRFDKAHLFREQYLKIDVLLIDDIQFLSKKEQTQETFFHIFNALHEQGKQIVITSDTTPDEIQGLHKRLISRMEWGLVADMYTPDFETKVAILTRKAESAAIDLPEDVCHFIAQSVNSNIRQLEGALVRIEAYASLSGQKITLSLAQHVLSHIADKPREAPDLFAVAECVAEAFDFTIADLRSKKRDKDLSAVRHIACYIMKKATPQSLRAIGAFFNGRDHSTVLHAISKVEDALKTDMRLAKKIEKIEKRILSAEKA